MMKTLLLVAWAACCLTAEISSIWPKRSDYIDFLATKNCFGEDIAVKLEKLGFESGRKCWVEEWGNIYGNSIGLQRRTKRNILKVPAARTDRLLICILKDMNLLTEESQMNYLVVDEWLKTNITDSAMSGQLLELSTRCQDQPAPEEPADPMLKSLVSFRTYMSCMDLGGTKICMDKEMKLVQEKMSQI